MSTRIKKKAQYRLHRKKGKLPKTSDIQSGYLVGVDFGSKLDQTIYTIYPGVYRFGKLFELDLGTQVVYNATLVRIGRQRLTRTWFTSELNAVEHAVLMSIRYRRIWGDG